MYKGIGVSAGIGIAQAIIWQPPIPYGYIPRHSAKPNADMKRFELAQQTVLRRNAELVQHATRRIGSAEASIFEAHCMLLEDEECINQPLEKLILQHSYTAEYAVYRHFNTLAQQMLDLDNEYMRQRSEDFYSLRDQLLRELMGYDVVDASHFDRPSVVVAHSLSPSEIAGMDSSRLQGIICETGGYASHGAIIARTLGIPMVAAVADICAVVTPGNMLALDGASGEVWVSPQKEALELLRTRYFSLQNQQKEIPAMAGTPTITQDGHRIELSANIGQPDEIETALAADSEAIGLYRIELFYLKNNALPSEEEHVTFYCNLLNKLGGKALTVRTLDAEEHTMPKMAEANRRYTNLALGYRGIRISLGRPQLFRAQLRALLRASAFGNIKVMFPMVSSLQELGAALETLEQIKNELRQKGIPFDEKMPIGVMVEVPAAVFLAPEMARMVDFFAIGINDLMQFILAADRSNPQLAHLYTVLHPAVLDAINTISVTAQNQGIPCHLCGEVNEPEKSLPLLLGMGLDGFSMGPKNLLRARQIITQCQYPDCQNLTNQVLKLRDTKQVEDLLDNWLNQKTPYIAI